jgi:hypothetical protein
LGHQRPIRFGSAGRKFARARLAESGNEARIESRYVESVTALLEHIKALSLGRTPEDAAALLELNSHHVHTAVSRAPHYADPDVALRLVAAHCDTVESGVDVAELEHLFESAVDRDDVSDRLAAAAEIALVEYAYVLEANHDVAGRHGPQAIARAERDAPDLLAAALIAGATVLEGNEAVATCERALALAQSSGDLLTELSALTGLAHEYLIRGDVHLTEKVLAEQYAKAADFPIVRSWCLGWLLSLNTELGRHSEARRYRDEGLSSWRRAGPLDLLTNLYLVAALAADEDDLDFLDEVAEEAQIAALRADRAMTWCYATGIRGVALASRGDPAAEHELRAALDGPGDSKYMMLMRVRVVLGECELVRGDVAAARENFIGVLSTPGCSSADTYARAMEDLAATSLASGHTADAVRQLGVARGHRKRTTCPVQPARLAFISDLEQQCRNALGDTFDDAVAQSEAIDLATEVNSLEETPAISSSTSPGPLGETDE